MQQIENQGIIVYTDTNGDIAIVQNQVVPILARPNRRIPLVGEPAEIPAITHAYILTSSDDRWWNLLRSLDILSLETSLQPGQQYQISLPDGGTVTVGKAEFARLRQELQPVLADLGAYLRSLGS